MEYIYIYIYIYICVWNIYIYIHILFYRPYVGSISLGMYVHAPPSISSATICRPSAEPVVACSYLAASPLRHDSR